MQLYKSGEKHNRLTLVSLYVRKEGGNLWNIKCDCGKEFIASPRDVRSGHTKSCGCYQKELAAARLITHGLTETKEYRIWCHMKGRCYNKKNKKYPRYGERGIKICDRWLNSFEDFLSDMGKCPKEYSIDRIDNNGNYEPGNCRWASAKTQSNNSTRPKFVMIFSKKVSCADAEKLICIGQSSLTQRVSDFKESHQQAANHFSLKHANKQLKSLDKCQEMLKRVLNG